MKWTSVFLLINTLGLLSCATFRRHEGSGYAYKNLDDYRDSLDSFQVQTQSALPTRKSAQATILNSMEKGLRQPADRELYYRFKPFIKSKQERIEFLAQKSHGDRLRWLKARGLTQGSYIYDRVVAGAIEEGDILIGMPKQAVRESWGDPARVEVAGDPRFGNEKWEYTDYVASLGGYKKELRTIFFESGRVVGWNRQ
jgi:hypothetical protein